MRRDAITEITENSQTAELIENIRLFFFFFETCCQSLEEMLYNSGYPDIATMSASFAALMCEMLQKMSTSTTVIHIQLAFVHVEKQRKNSTLAWKNWLCVNGPNRICSCWLVNCPQNLNSVSSCDHDVWWLTQWGRKWEVSLGIPMSDFIWNVAIVNHIFKSLTRSFWRTCFNIMAF